MSAGGHGSLSPARTQPSRFIVSAPPTISRGATPRLDLGRSPSMTGSVSGSASPNTRYGSFAPGTSAEEGKDHLEEVLRSKLSGTSRSRDHRRRWERSQERLIPRNQAGGAEDVWDSDADLSDDLGEGTSALRGRRQREATEDEVWNAGDEHETSTTEGAGRRPRAEDNGHKQWGVKKMELMSTVWGKGGLTSIYIGVYLISALTSLEGNTTPTIEPYFLSLLGSHSMLSSVVIITSIGFAVGKPPFTKILDVFGRAEGIALAATLYSIGYLLTAASTNVRIFIVARAISSLGGQGLQLAQQIIVADTTTLSNRGLITSTISLPWLVTTWLGPPIGAWFQRRGEPGYRIAYAAFGILLPVVAGVLFFTLLVQWRKVQASAARAGRTPSTMDIGHGSARRDWVDKGSRAEEQRARRPSFVDQVVLDRARRPRLTAWGKAKEVWRDLDVVGLFALTVGCGLFLLPFTLAAHGQRGWEDPEIWAFILAGVCTLAFFGYYEFQWSPIPVLPPRLLKNRTILAGSALGFFHFLSQFCYESFFTSFLQVARDHSPQTASYISQSYIFAACVAATLAGWGAKATNRYKWIGILGVLIHMAGTWLMMRTRNLDSSTFELVISQLLGGTGGGLTTIAAQLGCQSVVGHQDVAIATAIFLTITQIGGAVGGAGAGAVWTSLLPKRLSFHLPSDSETQALIPKIMASLPFAISFPMDSPIRQAINESYRDTQRVLNMMAILFLIPALIAILSMRDTNLETEDPGQGEGVVVLGRASFLADDEAMNSETSSLLGATSERERD
ncbi:major facilitator superfamily domain-containing protein [Leucosporidium creatinivorum]|uniref:Major facilitator superfamily domain-containing protein n=1 Tax=Leucosporidium creatinivorum TaxID=106004 RepID=A0A1Y2FZM2_9BASI|nr:major facilitator superfamily domain-containing protein [Leucosporidium creatinivorum]